MKNTIDSIELEVIENYIKAIRPPEEIRDQVDISYRIEKQSLFIFEIQPNWQDQILKRKLTLLKLLSLKKITIGKSIGKELI